MKRPSEVTAIPAPGPFMGEVVGTVALVLVTTAGLGASACARGQQWAAAEEEPQAS